MANWFCSVFNVVCRKRLSSQRCKSELIDSAWVVIVPGQKCINKYIKKTTSNQLIGLVNEIHKSIDNRHEVRAVFHDMCKVCHEGLLKQNGVTSSVINFVEDYLKTRKQKVVGVK